MLKGLIIYTGGGKGKTTSAAGLSVKAKSRGLSVLFAQFMKKRSGGEIDLLEKLGVKVLLFDNVLSPYFHPNADVGLIREEALKALASLRPRLKRFDLVVLDEFTHLLRSKIITSGEAMEFIKERPGGLTLVLTGRGAPAWLLRAADQVTEMKDIKHPARKGFRARKGIDY
jgi:cob(I)alamin adenosyltransferase